MEQIFIWGVALLVVVASVILYRRSSPSRLLPPGLAVGNELPAFKARDEDGAEVDTENLKGSPTVMLFVRGNWCPFCTAQVEDLAGHYREISEAGAKLIFVTPMPLETTKRVGEFYRIEFDYWLDENLKAIEQLGLKIDGGVPESLRKEYGDNTVWPVALVLDGDNVIRYAEISKTIKDRPSPDRLLREINALN